MKKTLTTLVAVFFIAIATLGSACSGDSKGSKNADINKIIVHIESNELGTALSACKSTSANTLKEGSDKILACILDELKYYLASSNWVNTAYALVKTDAINELKIYREILSLLSLGNTFTNATTFVSKALELASYTTWNEYHKADDNYLAEAQNYMNQGAPYRNTSWSTAVTYYEKAYTVANNAYYHFNGRSGKGMQEAANFYKAYATLIRNTINKKDNSAAEENAYNNASAAYKTIIQGYTDAISEIIDIVKTFPNKLY